MASSSLIVLLLSGLFLAVAHAYVPPPAQTPPPAAHERTVEPVVEGLVYCQSCKYVGSWSLDQAKPIPSAKVSVICKNYHHHVSYYKVLETNENGYFYGQLTGYKLGHLLLDHPLHACRVKLVSSPLENCNLLSNINYGMYGTKLRYDDKRLLSHGYDAVVYSAGPLAFRPLYCPPPTKDDESKTHE